MAFKINRVYTRSGDKGETALVGGQRVPKNDFRVQAYGDIDELNSALGVVKEHVTPHCSDLEPILAELQQELFDIGSELATPTGHAYEGMWTAAEADVARLEGLCDTFNDGLPELTSFIVPGGSKLASFIHLTRSIARRAERTIFTLSEQSDGAVSPALLKYINRLSDLLFILSRWVLVKEGKVAPLWIQAKDRNSGQ